MFASLHSGLLVRKGQAAPSLPEPVPAPRPRPDSWSVERRDALGPRTAAALKVVEVVPQTPAPAEPEPVAHPAGEPAYYRMELRLTPAQARKLGVAAARLGQPKRRLLVKALEAYLTVLAEGPLKGCGCFSGEAGESCCGDA